MKNLGHVSFPNGVSADRLAETVREFEEERKNEESYTRLLVSRDGRHVMLIAEADGCGDAEILAFAEGQTGYNRDLFS